MSHAGASSTARGSSSRSRATTRATTRRSAPKAGTRSANRKRATKAPDRTSSLAKSTSVADRRQAQSIQRNQRISDDRKVKAGVGTADLSRLRVNSRRAEDIGLQQQSTRAQGQLDRGVGIPDRGLQQEQVRQFLGSENETPQEEASRVRQDEFQRTGTVSPETEAAIFRLNNPDFVPPTLGQGRTGDDVRADIQGRADFRSQDPLTQKLGGLSFKPGEPTSVSRQPGRFGSFRSTAEGGTQRDVSLGGQAGVQRTEERRKRQESFGRNLRPDIQASEIRADAAKTKEELRKQSQDPVWQQEQIDKRNLDRNWEDQRVGSADINIPATIKNGYPTGRDGVAFVELTSTDVTERQRNKLIKDLDDMVQAYKDYLSIQDGTYTAPEDQALLDEEEQEAVQAEGAQAEFVAEKDQDRQTKLFQEQDTERTGKTIQRNRENDKDSSITNTSIEGFLSLIDNGTPEGTAMSNLYRNAFATYQQNEAIQRESGELQITSAQDSFNEVKSILKQGADRATTLFNDSQELLGDTRDRNTKLAADQAKLADSQLLYEKNKLTREAKAALSDDIDTRYATLALSGGFGSSNGLDDVAKAKATGEQSIRDLQQAFAFKRTDIMLSYTALVNTAEDTYATNVLTQANNLNTTLSNIDLQGIANQRTKDAAVRSAIQNMGNEITKERRAKALAYTGAAKTISDAIAAKAKANTKDSKNTGDKLTFKSSLRTQMNQNKIITLANDVDGFYGALDASFNRYDELVTEWKGGKLVDKNGDKIAADDFDTFFSDVALGPSQTGVIGSIARMFDPGSVVRSEEFLRQTQGQGLLDQGEGFIQALKAGGAGVSDRSLREMRATADRVHEAWEEKLSTNVLQLASDIDDWNESYPDQFVEYEDLFDINRIHIPQQRRDGMKGLYDGSTTSSTSVSGEDSYGLAQINMDVSYRDGRIKNLQEQGIQITSPEDLYNPEVNIQSMAVLSGGNRKNADGTIGEWDGVGNNFTPWSTYTSGKYKQNMGYNTDNIDIYQPQAEDIKQMLTDNGFSGKNHETAFAIIMAESRGDYRANYRPNQGIATSGVNTSATYENDDEIVIDNKPISVSFNIQPDRSGSTVGVSNGLNGGLVLTPKLKFMDTDTGYIFTVHPDKAQGYIENPFQYTPIT
jgi:hypothetical protein